MSHYSAFPRFSSKLVKNGEDFSLEQITNQDALEAIVSIHEEGLDFEEMQELMARMLEDGLDKEAANVRMIIVPQKTDSSKIFIVKVISHMVTDALSYLHATSMMQDGGWKNNPVPRPVSKRLSTWQVFTKLPELLGILSA